MNKVYFEDEKIDKQNKYVLHYRNGFIPALKQFFDKKKDLNKAVLELQKMGYKYSGKIGHDAMKSFYVTYNNELLLSKE